MNLRDYLLVPSNSRIDLSYQTECLQNNFPITSPPSLSVTIRNSLSMQKSQLNLALNIRNDPLISVKISVFCILGRFIGILRFTNPFLLFNLLHAPVFLILSTYVRTVIAQRKLIQVVQLKSIQG